MIINREMHKYSTNNTKNEMDAYQQEIQQIQQILKENQKGMTVTDIARKIKINRNSVAKYLDIMRIRGQVEMITFGPAKVFFPSRRIPISNLLNYTSDFIIIFDKELKISLVNDTFLKFLKTNREELIGEPVNDTILPNFKDNTDLSIAINESLDGKGFTKDIDFKRNGENHFFKIKVIPTTFEDGRCGVALIIKNETDNRIAELALIESQEKFSSLIDKLNKNKK